MTLAVKPRSLRSNPKGQIDPSTVAADERQVGHLQRLREGCHPHRLPLRHHGTIGRHLHGAVGLGEGVDGAGGPGDGIGGRRSLAARHEMDEDVLVPALGRVVSHGETGLDRLGPGSRPAGWRDVV